MSNYPEPVILAECDRSFGDRKEALRLEQDEYKGQPTFTLRVVWQGNDGNWRWSQQQPSQNSGKCFKALPIKANELLKLGEALISAARANGAQKMPPKSGGGRYQPPPQTGSDDDIPF